MSARRPAHSAGILLYRHRDTGLEVLLAHTGGPFWARKDLGAWSIPKGEYEANETPEHAARREFGEELGVPLPDGPLLDLGEITQKNGKRVRAWAVLADLDPATVVPGTIELEQPRGSGRMITIPEIDRVAWFTPDQAAPRMFAGQAELLDRLLVLL